MLNERDNCASGQSNTHAVWGWCSVNDAESETAWRHNRQANYLYVDGHAKNVPYEAGTAMGDSSGGHSVSAGLHRFPGYDWSHTDGSLWGAWNVLPGGQSLVPMDSAHVSCGFVPVDIPGSQNP
jgi:prepilin-type processing-associated H-X9-DG protein